MRIHKHRSSWEVKWRRNGRQLSKSSIGRPMP